MTDPIHSDRAFVSATARTSYLAMTVATFLMFTTGSSLSYLSKVLSTVGFDPAETGVMVASGAVPAVVCGLVAGRLLASWSARSVVALGMTMFTAGYASLAVTSATRTLLPPLASLAVSIGGVGLFLPGAFLVVRACAMPARLMQLVGIYGAMQLLPSIFGPTTAAWVFSHAGLAPYFLLTAIPAATGLALFWLTVPGTPRSASSPTAAQGATYLQLLGQARVLLPCLGGAASGSIFGVVNIFVVLLLSSARTPIHHFFVPFVIAYLGTRFLALSRVSRLDRAVAVASGLLLMALGIAALWAFDATTTGAWLAGVWFGVGFSVTYPVSIVWTSELFEPDARAKPVALFNALYTFGLYASPLAGGALLRSGGAAAFCITIVSFGVAAAATLLLLRGHARASQATSALRDAKA